MKEFNKYVFLNSIFFTVTVLLIVSAVYYQYRDVITEGGESVLVNWPYVRMAIQIALLIYFMAAAMARLKRVRELENHSDQISTGTLTFIFFFASGLIPFLHYPGLCELGLTSDPGFATVVGNLLVIQTIYFYLVVKTTLKEEVGLLTYALLLLLAFAVIWVAPYFSGADGPGSYIDH